MRLATMRVVNPADPSGFMIINAADFDAHRHEIWPPVDSGAPVPPDTVTEEIREHTVEIPPDWASLHFNRQIGLAKEVIGVDSDYRMTAAEARRILRERAPG